MKVIEPGHIYQVKTYDTPDEIIKREIVFFKRVGEGYPGNEGQPHEGTNCQELIRVLINRVKYLDKQIPCSENEEILDNLRSALWLFEERAMDRHGYEFPKNFIQDINIEDYPTCKTCGHIMCKHEGHQNESCKF